tara:strand:+ start:3779 stop:4183 length:405 start_codon:yes stop_codon:yes gene_type:complete
MVKNKRGGKGAKKQSNKAISNVTRTLLLKENEQNYGKIIKCLGNCHFELFGMDGKTYFGIIRGKMRKKVWIHVNTIVLFSYRNFEEDKVDIIHKYNDDEVRQLTNMNEIIKKVFDVENESDKKEVDDNIDFDEI